jgi:hypothetical protein
MKCQLARWTWIWLTALAASNWPAAGQSISLGTISGRITDPSGAVLPGVNVAITNTGTGIVRTVVVNFRH